MKLGYYPGCTLKSKAANLEKASIAALDALGVEYFELDRWNCCGAVFSLADDDLIHHVASVRNLVRAQEQGADTIVTICSQCYNTLARANLLMREDEEKRDTINRFMDEEADYRGEVEVKHFLTVLEEQVGWETIKKAVTMPLNGLKIAPFYGCTLVRPTEVSIDPFENGVLERFLEAVGAEPMQFSAATECCGSYQMIAHPEAGIERASKVIDSANRSGADALVLSCPLCEYNLGSRQGDILAHSDDLHAVPTFYFPQLLALALGLGPDVCRLDLNGESAVQLLTDKSFIAAATA